MGNTMAESAIGTTANVTTGIASAFAAGDTTDTCWNSASVPGTSATVTTAWVRAAARRIRPTRAIRETGGGEVRRPTPA